MALDGIFLRHIKSEIEKEALGTIAQLELLDDVIPEAAAAEIGHADTPSVYVVL